MPKTLPKTDEPEPVIHCAHDKVLPLGKLKPNPRNPNKHPEEQLRLLAKVIRFAGWRAPIVVSKRSGLIVKGHGRLEAAKLAGLKVAPVDVQEYETDEEELADLVADNRIAELAEMSLPELKNLLQELDTGAIDMEMTGFDPSALEALLTAAVGGNYTRKVEAPTYEIKGENPSVESLMDASKTKELESAIASAELSTDVRLFLMAAAQRHTVFNFERIAEFYAHADPKLQRLMEDSALVIIDFDKAIENGFVVLTDEIREAFAKDYPNA